MAFLIKTIGMGLYFLRIIFGFASVRIKRKTRIIIARYYENASKFLWIFVNLLETDNFVILHNVFSGKLL
jgi:hypothetical protein